MQHKSVQICPLSCLNNLCATSYGGNCGGCSALGGYYAACDACNCGTHGGLPFCDCGDSSLVSRCIGWGSCGDPGCCVSVDQNCALPSNISVANGGMGNCTGTLAGGASCNITCNAGYTPSGWKGSMTCSLGSLSSVPTCDQNCALPSNISVANGGMGNCNGALASGASCNIACNAGFTPSNGNGYMSCYRGLTTGQPTCIALTPNSSSVTPPPPSPRPSWMVRIFVSLSPSHP
jgi:hypothetical protein